MEPTKILLQNGCVVDGTGKKRFTGHVLIEKDKILEVSDNLPVFSGIDCQVIDCTDKVISPGFIDIHSHMDWFLVSNDRPEFTDPFVHQGITSFVAGNCGYGAAGFKKNTPFKHLLEDNLFKAGHTGLNWDSYSEYFDSLKRSGLTHNLLTLAGHGTTRTSVRGYDASPMKQQETKEILNLLEESMDQGARGVSFGFGYAPDIFCTHDQLTTVAKLVKRKKGLLTIHMRASSSISGAYPLKPFGTPHNLLALKEVLDLALKTRVRLQISHLIFVGTRSWKTFDRAMALIDQAIQQGADVGFDLFAYDCGASVITTILPDWFMAELPGAYHNQKLLKKLNLLMNVSFKLLGFDFRDIQIASANHPDLEKFNGMFLSEIAKIRKVSPFQNYLDFAEMSNSTARVLMHKYNTEQITAELMTHPAAYFMTDAWIEPQGGQNPAAFGCFPHLLQLAREKNLSLEKTIHKMTEGSAKRVGIKDRGALKPDMAADITLFDWKTVRDNNTREKTNQTPTGIEAVFINGTQVLKNGRVDTASNPGVIL
ncbi:MAG: amidohydrolase family protein [Proteobacteria bacterium]|nr:amidohydrolase family protein [Desulfobacula sp.]MBU3953451.1 amidohydrolase family protein [Pseudomonadota bacterium]MBU4131187.1 amidohydrolase family protein [Pseudomonadota bacterium]